jgi:enterochelin esterase-like enzyme/outer membrane protein assembly factor BamB
MERHTTWIRGALLTVAIWGALIPGTPPAAADWDRWLGPEQNGSVGAAGLFPEGDFGLEVAWQRPLGVSYSGIVVVGDRAVTMFGDGETDWLIAVDAATGEEVWRYEIAPMYAPHDGSEGGSASTPVVDADLVYGLGAAGRLFAVGLEDGREAWSHDIVEVLGARAPSYGFSTTPLVVGDLLFLQSGGTEGRSLAAFDKKTGELRWSTGDDPVGYQSPVLATLAGREQIVAVTNTRILGLDPRSGEVLWSHQTAAPEESRDGYSTPLVLGEDRFLLAAQEESKAFRLSRADGAFELEELWTTTELKQSLAAPVQLDGLLYGFSGDFLTCFDPSAGERIWKSRPPGGRGLILVDGHLVVFANDGAVVAIEATPEGYREKARVEVSETGSYTYPSYADGTFFVRNTRDLAAVRVGPAPARPAVAARPEPRNDFERFVRRVEDASDKRLLVDDFMASQRSFPVVEDNRWVHFLYRGEAEDVALAGTMYEYQVEEPLERVEGTDLFYRSEPIEPGMRWEYRFNVDFENPQPDPLNPIRVAGGLGDVSEVAASGQDRPGYLRPYTGPRPGRIDSFVHASEILENEREVHVYLPAGYDGDSRRYPLLVVDDGKDWLANAHLANTLDHLVGSTVAPLLVAFVELPEGTGRVEFGGEKSADHMRMLVEELLPVLDERYRTVAEAGSRAIMGVGAGGLMATWTAIEHRDAFGLAAAHSIYLANPEAPGLTEAVSRGAGGEPPRFWITWNRAEVRRAEWNVDIARDSRRVTEMLEAEGFPVVGREATDSSGWGSWRVRAAEVLQQMFPN